MDRFLAESNRVADHTVFVSEWLRDYHGERWFDLGKPHSVIVPGERGFSLEVWAALAGGRPVVYPQGLAYWEQVFHGGMAYEGEDFSEAFAAAQASECELRSLIRVPEFRDAEKFIRTLLSV